jgi:hypothetical protein
MMNCFIEEKKNSEDYQPFIFFEISGATFTK